jgi:hypothetical protein
MSFAVKAQGSEGAAGPMGNPISGKELVTEFKVYPNPSSNGNFTVEFSLETSANLNIKVYNLIGKEVFADRIDGDNRAYSNTIRLGNLPKGVYILEVSNGGQKQTKRLSYI